MADDDKPATSPTSKQAGQGLTKRIGPLPLWAWGAVIVGAIILYKIMKDRSAASTTTASGTVAGQNNANSLFGSEGFSTNTAGEVIDNATGNILGTFGGATGGSTNSTNTFAQWTANAQQALFNLGYNNTNVDQALQDYASGQPLPQSEYGIIEAAINLVGNPPSGIALPQLQSPAAPGSGGSTPGPSLPTQLNAQNFPLQVLYGQYASSDYTKIGTFTNGQYSGYNVIQGAPVYGTAFGGFFQDFNPATYNGDVYVPTSLIQQGYVPGYSGTTQVAHATASPAAVAA